MKQYVSEIVNQNYQKWKGHDVVFISSPTGSGKTTFVLNELLEYVASKKMKLLYLVNRTLLKAQIEEKISVDIMHKLRKNKSLSEEDIKDLITVKTYQEIEELCKRKESISWGQGKFRYIVADEAHYFFTDSLFNPSTEISLNWIMDKRSGGDASIIFMSATIGRIKDYIIKKYCLQPFDSEQEGVSLVRGEEEINTQSVYHDYSCSADYSRISLKLLNTVSEIPSLIEGGGKWLIFVDDINKGYEIQRLLKEAEIENKFIQAKVKYSEEVIDEVQGIVKNENFTKQVLIATSVLDNGINIKDFSLRNLIIMADTFEEFMQMLGRKRVLDEEQEMEKFINVYILQRSKEEFKRKQQMLNQKMKFIYEKSHDEETPNILKKILENPQYHENASCLCYTWGEKIVLSHLSVEQCDYLYDFYDSIIKKFDVEGESAFVKEQVQWLGYTGEEQDQYVKKLMETIKEKICRILDTYVDKEMNKEMNLIMREELRENFIKLLKSCSEHESEEVKSLVVELKKASGVGKKNPRTIAEEKFNQIMEILKLKYKMEKPTGSIFKITKKEA